MNVLMKCAPIFEAHLLSHCLGPVNMSGPDITPISPLSVSDVYRLLATEQLTAIHAIKRLGETLGPDAGIQDILDGFRRRYEETEAAYEAVMLSEYEATTLAIVQEHQRQQQQLRQQKQQHRKRVRLVTPAYDTVAPAYEIAYCKHASNLNCGKTFRPVSLAQGISWHHLLQFIPFSDTVCVAGSVGTWFAQWNVTSEVPMWIPGDIDVFVRAESPAFTSTVLAVARAIMEARRVPLSKHDQFLDAVTLAAKRDIVDMKIGNVTLSFIRVHSDKPIYDDVDQWVSQLLREFDINVCKVALHRLNGSYRIECDGCILNQIRSGVMVAMMQPSCHHWNRIYNLRVRSFKRLKKYEDRGFRLKSIMFRIPHMTVDKFQSVFHCADDEFQQRVLPHSIAVE